MATMKQTKRGRVLVGKLGHGADLLEEIAAICRGADIRLGRVQAIGAVQKARLAYYDQHNKIYEFFGLDEPLEILNLTGNVSIGNGQPTVHAHVTLANRRGATLGGHLASGTVVFAGECIVEEFLGQEYARPVGMPGRKPSPCRVRRPMNQGRAFAPRYLPGQSSRPRNRSLRQHQDLRRLKLGSHPEEQRRTSGPPNNIGGTRLVDSSSKGRCWSRKTIRPSE